MSKRKTGHHRIGDLYVPKYSDHTPWTAKMEWVMLMSRERSLRWGKEEIDVKVMRLTGEQEIYTWYYFVRYFEPFDAKRHTKGWK